MDWSRLGRYLAGECTAREAEKFRRRLEADPDLRQTAEELRAVWSAAATPGDTWDTPSAWRRLAARLHSREPRARLALVRGEWPGGRPAGAARWAAAAAVAGLAIAGGLRWSGRPTESAPPVPAAVPLREVRVPAGQRAQFQLAEGTRVLLGPGTVLRYDTAAFGQSTRELHLDGQAHFVVTHDPTRPFLVRTSRTVTEDLGTEFAITDYAGDPAGEVVVASGTVAVRSVLSDTTRPATLLHRGDLVRLDPGGRATVQSGVDLRARLAWIEGRLAFVDTPVRDVVTRINRWYGGDVRLGDPALARHRFTATYGAAAESTVVRELATSIGAAVQRRGGSLILVPLSDQSREK